VATIDGGLKIKLVTGKTQYVQQLWVLKKFLGQNFVADGMMPGLQTHLTDFTNVFKLGAS
jgi:hypothetical protein